MQRENLLYRATRWLTVELGIRPAGVSPAMVAGVLRAMFGEALEGGSSSCTTSYQRIAAELGAEQGKQPARRQVALAVAWLKGRGWVDVLNQGPGGGSYTIQWPQLSADLDGEATHSGPTGADSRQVREGCGAEPTFGA
jgi:hypothetical protein